LADPTQWTAVEATVDVPNQSLALDLGDGTVLVAHTHNALAVAARLTAAVPSGPDTLLDERPSAPCVLNRKSGILGLPSDRRVRAGRSYVSISPYPLRVCAQEHDAGLAREFEALTEQLRTQ
jgi:hypothetical protein